MAEMKKLSDEIAALDEQVKDVRKNSANLLLGIPNTPNPDDPIGKDDSDNVEIRRWGEPRVFDFEHKAHWDIGTDLDILDFDRAAKLSGCEIYRIQRCGGKTRKSSHQLYAQSPYRRAGLPGNPPSVHGRKNCYDWHGPAS